jgi:hypothetical protein
MGAAKNETENFPVCDAKPRKFTGETTFSHLLRGDSNGSSTRRNERAERENWDDWTGGPDREA